MLKTLRKRSLAARASRRVPKVQVWHDPTAINPATTVVNPSIANALTDKLLLEHDLEEESLG